MFFEERNEGDFRIFAGAREALQGDGYVAAVIVNRWRGDAGSPREAFREENLACGHRWATADAALSFAMNRGQQLIRNESTA